ncbi:MAG: acetate--CoA ligase family protein [Chloroflexota bacterium]|nr:acetate--CoA ligase family protein [Chloroflexota bacterium]
MSARETIEKASKSGKTWLTEVDAKQVLREAGVSVVDTRLATSRQQAVSLARDVGFPAALKVVSPDIFHKSDVGGVKLNLPDEAAVGRAYDEILAAVKRNAPKAVVEGLAVQRMARPGIEVIIGVNRDALLGPVIMFGLGGIWVEVMKDVSMRVVPISRWDASQMVQEIRGFPLLKGLRGQSGASIPALEEMLLRVSALAAENPEIKELDLNPVFAYSDGAVAVDAKLVLEPQPNAVSGTAGVAAQPGR